MVGLAWLSSYAVLASRAASVLRRPRVRAAMSRLTGVVLIALAYGSPPNGVRKFVERLDPGARRDDWIHARRNGRPVCRPASAHDVVDPPRPLDRPCHGLD
jgi:hypothetical protein